MSEKNYQEYVYKEGTKIEMDKDVFEALFPLINEIVKDNSEITVKEHYIFINNETGKEVKSVKPEDLKSGKITKVVNTEKLFDTEPETTYNIKALNYISMLLRLNQVHAENVDNGKAIHMSEVKNEAK